MSKANFKAEEIVRTFKRYDPDEGIEVKLSFRWEQLDSEDDDDSIFTVRYTVNTDNNECVMVQGTPNDQSYRDLITSASDPNKKGVELVIYTASLPTSEANGQSCLETAVWIPLDGPMGFRESILEIGKDAPPQEAELVQPATPPKKKEDKFNIH
ncbi:MAG: hypothetical protein U0487_00805 [Patescibacteria group bacterium]